MTYPICFSLLINLLLHFAFDIFELGSLINTNSPANKRTTAAYPLTNIRKHFENMYVSIEKCALRSFPPKPCVISSKVISLQQGIGCSSKLKRFYFLTDTINQEVKIWRLQINLWGHLIKNQVCIYSAYSLLKP